MISTELLQQTITSILGVRFSAVSLHLLIIIIFLKLAILWLYIMNYLGYNNSYFFYFLLFFFYNQIIEKLYNQNYTTYYNCHKISHITQSHINYMTRNILVDFIKLLVDQGQQYKLCVKGISSSSNLRKTLLSSLYLS